MSETEVAPPEPGAEPVPEPEPLEPDEPDGEPDEEPAAPEEPAEAPAQPTETEALMSKRFDASQRAFKSYTTRLSTVFEEDALHHIPCPLCPDYHKGYIDVRDAGNVPDEIKNVVLEYMGYARKADYEPDPETNECPTCKGLGLVRTGSRVTGNEERKCSRCHGYGFVPPPDAPSNGHHVHDDFLAPVGEHASPLEEPDEDVAGEPRLLPDGRVNPNYGKWPQYKVLVQPWGVTAGLTVQDAVS